MTLSAETVKQRALTGAALVTMRGVVVRLMGFASNIVVARFVAPEDFGVFTLGAAVLTAGTLFADAGMAAALVRQPQEPDEADLAAVQGLQLLISGLIAIVAVCVGALFGREGLIVAVMAASLPIVTLRVPALAVLERHLDYKPVVSVEIAETLGYTLFLVGVLAAGGGVWGLSAAVVFRAVVGTYCMVRVGPLGLVRPSVDMSRIRPILRFGAQFQTISAVPVVNAQLFNAGVAAIAGFGVLGIWGMTNRILQLPQLIFVSLRRVSYPAMARLITSGDELAATVERTARLTTVAAGSVLSPLVASAPAVVPLVFGERWSDAVEALPGACLGLLIGGPVSVAVAAYLLAAGRAGVVLRATVLRVAVMLAISLSLLPSLGVGGIGIGYFAGSLVEAAILGAAARRDLGVQLSRALLPGCAASLVSGGLGWLVTEQLGIHVLAACAGASASAVSFLALAWLMSRDTLTDMRRLGKRLVDPGARGARDIDAP